MIRGQLEFPVNGLPLAILSWGGVAPGEGCRLAVTLGVPATPVGMGQALSHHLAEAELCFNPLKKTNATGS